MFPVMPLVPFLALRMQALHFPLSFSLKEYCRGLRNKKTLKAALGFSLFGNAASRLRGTVALRPSITASLPLSVSQT
jgi:hypothetical protein